MNYQEGIPVRMVVQGHTLIGLVLLMTTCLLLRY